MEAGETGQGVVDDPTRSVVYLAEYVVGSNEDQHPGLTKGHRDAPGISATPGSRNGTSTWPFPHLHISSAMVSKVSV